MPEFSELCSSWAVLLVVANDRTDGEPIVVADNWAHREAAHNWAVVNIAEARLPARIHAVFPLVNARDVVAELNRKRKELSR